MMKCSKSVVNKVWVWHQSDLSLYQVSKHFPEMMPLIKEKGQGKGGHDRQRAQLLQTFRSVTGFGMFGELPVDQYDCGVRVWVLERPPGS